MRGRTPGISSRVNPWSSVGGRRGSPGSIRPAGASTLSGHDVRGGGRDEAHRSQAGPVRIAAHQRASAQVEQHGAQRGGGWIHGLGRARSTRVRGGSSPRRHRRRPRETAGWSQGRPPRESHAFPPIRCQGSRATRRPGSGRSAGEGVGPNPGRGRFAAPGGPLGG